MRRVRWRRFLRLAIFLLGVLGELSLLTTRARAQSVGEALLQVFVGGATRGLLNALIPEPVATPPTPEPHVELSDWVDPVSGSTAHVGRACEQRYVAYLTGTRGLNYLEVKLFNDSEQEAVIAARSRAFGGTLRPWPGSRHGRPVRAPGHSGKFLRYELEKPRFHELRQFEVVFELSFADGRTCQMRADFARVLPAAPSTFKLYSKAEVGLSYGFYVASGSLRDAVGQVGAGDSVSASWFPALQHGVRLELGSARLHHSDRFAAGTLVLPSYEYRIFLSPRVTYSFGIGAGAYVFTGYHDMPDSDARWALLVRERMQLKLELFPPDRENLNFALCPTVTFGVLSGGPFGPHELSGGLYTGALEVILSL